MQSPGYDHLGILCDTRQEVDDLLELAKKWRDKDDRVRILEFPKDLVTGSGHGARVLRAVPAADPVRRAVHRVRRGLRARRSAGRTPERPRTPKNLVVVLLDSLNRHFLDCYLDEAEQRAAGGATGVGEWADLEPVATPEPRSARGASLRFDKHWSGSLPCMPARHDLLVGALDFLWRPWGSIEIWEDPITYDLQRAGVTTMLVSDHPHLFEIGGENYHTDFTAWHYERGHESDPWRTRPDPTWTGTPALPAEAGVRAPRVRRLAHVVPRGRRLPRAAHDAGGRAVAADERAAPRPLPAVRRRVRSARTVRHARAVGDAVRRGVDGPRLIWPPYSTETIAKGRLQPNEARQIRGQLRSRSSR